MTLKRTPLKPVRTDATRAKALAAIEHATIEVAQRTSAESFDWVVVGTQMRRFGDNREIVIRLEPWKEPE